MASTRREAAGLLLWPLARLLDTTEYKDLPWAERRDMRAGMLPPSVLLSTPTCSAWEEMGR